MDKLPSKVEVAFVLDVVDASVEAELRNLFPNAEISTADNFIGGAEIAIYLNLAKEFLALIFSYVSKNKDRVASGTLRISDKSIEFTNYTPAQVEQFLKLPELQEALKTLKS
jgi:hypothetical protein